MKSFLPFAIFLFCFSAWSQLRPDPNAFVLPTQPPNENVKNICAEHFPSGIQETMRRGCWYGAMEWEKTNRAKAVQTCQQKLKQQAREQMACIISASIHEDQKSNSDAYKVRLELCQQYYPIHIEIDSYLQESCLSGVHLAHSQAAPLQLRSCSSVSQETSFLGPCAVGLALEKELQSGTGTSSAQDQVRLCGQYFDKTAFHTGYRACLNSRGLALDWRAQYKDVLKGCTSLVSNAKNESEKAACLVGASLFHNLLIQKKPNPRFAKCGDNKVSYADRDYLACLTAASLLDFTGAPQAGKACKEIFSSRKSRSRADCTRSLEIF